MEYPTRHLYFLGLHTRLKACVYTRKYKWLVGYLAIIEWGWVGYEEFCRSRAPQRPNVTQPCPQVFAVNGSIICSGLHFWRHFDVNGSIIFGGLHFWRHWINMAKILSKFGEQQLVMVNYECGFNQSETGKYFEWITIHGIPLQSVA